MNKLFKYIIIFCIPVEIFAMEEKKSIWSGEQKRAIGQLIVFESKRIKDKQKPLFEEFYKSYLINEIANYSDYDGNSNPLLLQFSQRNIEKQVQMELEHPGSSMMLLPLRQQYEKQIKRQNEDSENELQKMREQHANTLLNLKEKWEKFHQEVLTDKINDEIENPKTNELFKPLWEKYETINKEKEKSTATDEQYQTYQTKRSNIKIAGSLITGIAIGYSIKLICDKYKI